MVAILASGSAQKLYSVDVDQHMYNNYGEMEPFVAKDYIVRTTDENTLTPDRLGIPWDCAIGILMYGIHADIAETFSELKRVIATTLDMEEDWDGPMEGLPSMMALFQSPTQDISLDCRPWLVRRLYARILGNTGNAGRELDSGRRRQLHWMLGRARALRCC